VTSGWFVTASDIKQWTATNKRRAEDYLPALVRNLIQASCKTEHVHFPAGDSVSIAGWDGSLKAERGNQFVPTGTSAWEFGTDRSIKAKADRVYRDRSDNARCQTPSQTTFVFVTSRAWRDKDRWCTEKEDERFWWRVNGLNADDLENWLLQCPAVHRQFARLIGKRTETVWDVDQAWQSWAYVTDVPAVPEVVLNGRADLWEELQKSLKGDPAIVRVKASSEDEAYAFSLATLMQDEQLAPRVLVVNDESQWDILLDSQNALILIP